MAVFKRFRFTEVLLMDVKPDAVRFSRTRQLSKSVNHSLLACCSLLLSSALPFIPAESKREGAAAILVVLEYGRGVLKFVFPKFFAWL